MQNKFKTSLAGISKYPQLKFNNIHNSMKGISFSYKVEMLHVDAL